MDIHDIVLEIFSRLLAKSIYKFKRVNKLCNNISSPGETYFFWKQSQNASLRDDSCFFMQPYWWNIEKQIEFHGLSPNNTTSGASDGFFQFLEDNLAVDIIASSNGLILGRSDTTEFFICNPVTQSYLPIPIPDDLETNLVAANRLFVLDCNVEDSKEDFMLHLFVLPDEWDSPYFNLKSYSVGEGMWKSVEAGFFRGSRLLRFDHHVYYRKALHFISDCFPYIVKGIPYFRPYIMSYTVEYESSRMIRVPKEARRGSHDLTCKLGIYKWRKLTSSDESICLVRLRKKVFTIWVLTDYEISKWRRILKVRVKAMGVKDEDPIIVTGFTVMNGDCLVFATKTKVYGYGLLQEKFMKLEEICEHGIGLCPTIITAYSDTLCPYGSTTMTLPILQQ